MPKPAVCGLRIAHAPHPMEDGGTLCPGKPWPKHYDAHHRGRYRSELEWAEAVPCGTHRRECAAVLTHEPEPLRPHPRLGWHDPPGEPEWVYRVSVDDVEQLPVPRDDDAREWIQTHPGREAAAVFRVWGLDGDPVDFVAWSESGRIRVELAC